MKRRDILQVGISAGIGAVVGAAVPLLRNDSLVRNPGLRTYPRDSREWEQWVRLLDSQEAGDETGQFTVTWPNTTFTIADSHVWYYTRIGAHVKAMYVAAASGTSNATTFVSDVSVPAAIRPETTHVTTVEIQDNGTREVGFLGVTAAGSIQVLRVGAASFTASGTKALRGTNFIIHWFLGDHTAFPSV